MTYNCNLKMSVTSLENYVSEGNKGNFCDEKNKHYVIRLFYYKRVLRNFLALNLFSSYLY